MLDEPRLDPKRITRCMLMVETDDGVQRGWHVDNITEIGWDYLGSTGGSAQGRFRVAGQFWRKRKSTESRKLEARMNEAIANVNRVIDVQSREADLDAGWAGEIGAGDGTV